MVTTQVDRESEDAQMRPARPSFSLRDRLVVSMPTDAVWGWLGALLVTAFAAALRFYRLGDPHAVVFDETYYAKDALALLRYGVEHNVIDGADKQILAGHANIFTAGGSYVVHPPAGKWLIAVGEWLFHVTPFGWRFSAAVVGSLSVLILIRVARRMTRSTLLGCVAGLLLALDGLQFTQSRVALLDIFLMFWVVAAFACLVADRDAARARLANRLLEKGYSPLGPWLGVRWWRLAAGVCLGLACATKWSAVPYIAAFGLLSFGWDAGARRGAGVRNWFGGALVRDAGPAFLSLVVLSGLVYVASWTGWFLSDEGWDRHWADSHAMASPGWVPAALGNLVPGSLRSLWHYHTQIWDFHTNLHSSHTYQSQPWSWLLLLRPVAYYYATPQGCGASHCSSEVLGIGTPTIWWAAMPALLVMVALVLTRLDWRAAAVILGVAAGWLPWFASPGRTEFLFYALPMLPFLVLAITISLGLAIGRANASAFRRGLGTACAGAYVLLVIVNFWYLYPVLAAQVVPYDAWHARMWLSSWI